MSGYASLLKNKYFLLLWNSQFLSQLAINTLNFLLLIRIFSLTSSSIATSFLWVSYSLPVVIIGPLASAIVDIVDRRKVLIISNFLQFLTVLIYALIFDYKTFLIYGVAIIYSFLNQFYMPGENASLPILVKKENLPEANSLFFITQNVSLIMGWGLAGIFKKMLGFQITLLFCSLFLFAAFVSVFFLPKIESTKVGWERIDDLLFVFFKKIKEGYDFIVQNRPVLFPFLLLLSMEVGVSVVVVNIPLFVREVLMVNIDKAGFFVFLPAGLGVAFGGLVIPQILRKKTIRKKKVIEYSLFAISFSLFMISFLFVFFTGFWHLFFSTILIFILGFSYLGVIISSQTFLQFVIPKELRGRIFGNFWFLVTLANIFPVILSGTIGDLLGARFFVLMLASICFLVYIMSKKKGDYLMKNGRISSSNRT